LCVISKILKISVHPTTKKYSTNIPLSGPHARSITSIYFWQWISRCYVSDLFTRYIFMISAICDWPFHGFMVSVKTWSKKSTKTSNLILKIPHIISASNFKVLWLFSQHVTVVRKHRFCISALLFFLHRATF
jgi:hypothetical protein